MKRIINYILFASSLIFMGLNNTYAADCISCGTDILPIPIGIPKFVSSLITIAQVAVPVLIIVISMVNYIKAVGNGEDKVIREVNLKFIRSLIAGVAIFLLVAIVRFAFGNLLGATGNNALACISCFMDSSTCATTSCIERPNLEEVDSCSHYETEDLCDADSMNIGTCKWSNTFTMCMSEDLRKEYCESHSYINGRRTEEGCVRNDICTWQDDKCVPTTGVNVPSDDPTEPSEPTQPSEPSEPTEPTGQNCMNYKYTPSKNCPAKDDYGNPCAKPERGPATGMCAYDPSKCSETSYKNSPACKALKN